MATNMKRFTITVDNEMELALDRCKQGPFCNKSQSEMVRYLIRIGLESSKDKKCQSAPHALKTST